jgi:hypothetical protein
VERAKEILEDALRQSQAHIDDAADDDILSPYPYAYGYMQSATTQALEELGGDK